MTKDEMETLYAQRFVFMVKYLAWYPTFLTDKKEVGNGMQLG